MVNRLFLLLLKMEELPVRNILDVEPLKPELLLPLPVFPPEVEVLVLDARGHLRDSEELAGFDDSVEEKNGDLTR